MTLVAHIIVQFQYAEPMGKFIQYLSKNDTVIIAAILTITVLGFSIFASLYSSLLHNAETADGNRLQSNESNAQSYWKRFSDILRKQVQSRALSANLCFWGLVLFLFTFIFHYLFEKPLWAILLSISLGFVFVATLNFILNGHSQRKRFVRYLKCFKWPIDPKPLRLYNLRDNH